MSQTEHQFRIAEIDVLKIASDERIAGVFRFEQQGAANRGPTLLIVADIHSSLYAYERLLDVLNSTAEQARHLVVGVSQDPVIRFEKLVQRVNEAIASFEELETSPLNWKRVNLFLIELTEGHLCFTGIGRLMNAFFQKQPDGSFRSFDLLGSLDQPRDTDPKKPFASLVCGDIRPGDVLIAGTDNLERLRGELQMKERLTTLPPVSAALEIRNDIERRSIPDHFVAAVISCQEVKRAVADIPVASQEEQKDNSTVSIEKLRQTEVTTTQHLSPVVSPVKKLPASVSVFAKARTGARRLFASIRALLAKNQKTLDAVSFASLRSMNAGYGSFFTKRRKVLVYGACGILAALILGGLIWKQARKTAAERALWQETYDGALDQRNRAEADLIYGNDGRGKAEIDAASQALAGLTGGTNEQKSSVEKLKQDLSGLKDRLKKLVKTENVTELTALASAADGSLSAPVLTADAAYAADNSTGAILKITLATKAVKTIRLPGSSDRIVGGTVGKDSVLFATQSGKLYALKKSDDTVSSMKWSHSRTSSTTDVVLYASKLYSLDASKNQVWRSVNSGGGFTGDTPYVKATSESIGNAVSLAIDSSVYVLKQDGTVLRFLSGGLEGYAPAGIEPPLASGSAIWTVADNDRVAIVDPTEKRIVFFDKNGALKAQVVSSQFQSPRDLDADEANKRMIVVDGNRLLLVPMP